MSAWPALDYASWQETCTTLHLWTQVVGKVRMACCPMTNHWWQVPLYVTSRGLTTSPMPHGARVFQIDFDFLDHRLDITASDGARDGFDLCPMSVASFHAELSDRLAALDLAVRIWTRPVEVAEAIPFEDDHGHCAYDKAAVRRFWQALVQADRVLKIFRARFMGKASPVHFFWGSFDLAVTRFSGRLAPPHPGGMPNLGDWVAREAYTHEVSSCGFWPGNGGFGRPAFYSYAYPEPDGFGAQPVAPEAAYYDEALREFVLPYQAVADSATPDTDLLAFLQSTYEAAATLGGWDRAGLER